MAQIVLDRLKEHFHTELLETASQLVELRALGATGAQGFLFGRPVGRQLDDPSTQWRQAS